MFSALQRMTNLQAELNIIGHVERSVMTLTFNNVINGDESNNVVQDTITIVCFRCSI